MKHIVTEKDKEHISNRYHSGFTPKQKIILSVAGLVTILGGGFYFDQYLNRKDLENKFKKSETELNKKFNPKIDLSYQMIESMQQSEYFRSLNPQDTTNIDTLKTFEIKNFGKYHLGQTSSMNSQTFIVDMNNDGYPDIVRIDPYTDDVWIYKNNIRDTLERK